MSDSIDAGQKGFFAPTIWSTIIKARPGQEEQVRRAALQRLLERYYQPIQRHMEASLSAQDRSLGKDAQDLTHQFVCHCLENESFLKNVSPEKGRFRTFIKACIKNFLRDLHERGSAAKRGAGQLPASLDETDEEGNRRLDPAGTGELPDTLLDREWALSVLESALKQLEHECVAARRGDLFALLKGHLGRAPEPGTAQQVAKQLGMSEGAVHTAMNRLRGRLGELIREEVRQTVGTDADWREELKYLIELLGR